MASYTVIGGDGKPYGPITGEDVRRWVAEGRLNAQSLAKGEGDAEYRTLATFPEFSHLLGIAPASAPGVAPLLNAPVDGRQVALDKVRVPAIGLMISAITSMIFATSDLVSIFFLSENKQDLDSYVDQFFSMFGMGDNAPAKALVEKIMHAQYGPLGIANDLFQIIIAILIFVGSRKMVKLHSYEFAYSAAVLSVVPCISPCCGWVLGLIFGFWAMSALGKVKPFFS